MAIIVESAAGVIDGINDAFQTSSKYEPGSLLVMLNGQSVNPHIEETIPATGIFRITDVDFIPRSGAWGSDSVTVDYSDGEGGGAGDCTQYLGEPVAAVIESSNIINGEIIECPV